MGKRDSSHASLRSTVADLFEPRALIYWSDFLFHVTVGWLTFIYALTPTLAAWQQWSLIIISSFALFRSAVFTHELVHLRRDRLQVFRLTWGALCGIPLLVPSFLYDGVHQEHHFRSQYGTKGDGEYLPFGRASHLLLFGYLLSHILAPGLLLLRFAVIGPLSWRWPWLRRRVLIRMSSLSIDPTYRRTLPEQIPMSWIMQDVACTIFIWSVLVLIAYDVVPAAALGQWYVMTVLVLTFNGIRTLVAHRYRNEGGTMSFDAQLLDSINLTGHSPFTPLLAPVGLRYHALHHLFPTMPYHNLVAAHRRLLSDLPDDAIYRQTIEPGLVSAFVKLWRSCRQAA